MSTTKYKMCTGFDVIQLHETNYKFKVNQNNGPVGDLEQGHIIDVWEKVCTSGKWQNYGCPCIDAMAYYRLVQGNAIEEVLMQKH
jgi:hypothetical protein